MPNSLPIDPFQSMSAYFAYELRRHREERNLSQDGLAKELYKTRSAIEAYENQRNRPDKEFAELLDSFFSTGLHFQAIWHHAQREHLKQWQQSFILHEQEAADVKVFQPLSIPGLFQTERYMRSRMEWATDIEQRVAVRMARRDVLTKSNPPYVWVVLDEVAIRRPVGGPEVMVEQLQHLLDMADRPNVTLQVIPESIGSHRGMDGGLVLFTDRADLSVGYAEAQFGGRLIEDPEEVRRLQIQYGQIAARALSDVDSRDLIQKTLEKLNGSAVAEEQP